MTEKEKQAIALIRKGASIEKVAQITGISPFWLSLKTGKGV